MFYNGLCQAPYLEFNRMQQDKAADEFAALPK